MSRKKTLLSELNLKKVGGRINYIRLKMGLSQAQFAENVRISIGNLSGLENHKYEPSYSAIIKILEVYEVNSIWLLTGEGEMIREPGKEGETGGKSLPIYNEGDDPELIRLIQGARKVLTGGNKVAYDALKQNIEYFSKAVDAEKNLGAARDELTTTKSRLNGMEARLATLEKAVAEVETSKEIFEESEEKKAM